jgi:hypothetical protein
MAFAALEVAHGPNGVTYLVRAMPKGGLKDTVDAIPSAVGFVSGMPGELGILGLLINKVVYRGRYVVEVRTIANGSRGPLLWTRETRNLREANALADDVVARLNAGSAPDQLPTV